MAAYEAFRRYTDTVCAQVRWKRVRPLIAQELSDHLEDQCEVYRAKGQEEASAARESLRQMGDPVALGAEFDRTHRPRSQWALLLLAAGILLLGFFLRVPLGLNGGVLERTDWLALGLSFALCAGAYFLDVSFLGRFALPLYGLTVLGAYLAYFVVKFLSGTRWIHGGMLYLRLFDLQIDLRLCTLLAPVSFALLLYALRGRAYRGLFLAILGYLPWTLLLLNLPDIHGVMLYSLVAYVLLMMAVRRGWLLVNRRRVSLGLTLCALTGIAAYLYLLVRGKSLLYALRPALAPDGIGEFFLLWQNIRRGLALSPVQRSFYDGAARQEGLGLVRMLHNFGWLATVAVVLLFVLLCYLLLRQALRQSSMQGRLISTAISLVFVIETLAFVFNNLLLTLTTYGTLPLFAGTNDTMVIHALLLGFLLSIFRNEPLLRDASQGRSASARKRITWRKGELVIDLRRRKA